MVVADAAGTASQQHAAASLSAYHHGINYATKDTNEGCYHHDNKAAIGMQRHHDHYDHT
jgi:hypothetical protein